MPDVLVLSALFPKLLGARVILDLHDPMPELMLSIYNLPREAKLVRVLERLERMSMNFADWFSLRIERSAFCLCRADVLPRRFRSS